MARSSPRFGEERQCGAHNPTRRSAGSVFTFLMLHLEFPICGDARGEQSVSISPLQSAVASLVTMVTWHFVLTENSDLLHYAELLSKNKAAACGLGIKKAQTRDQ